MVSIVLSLFSLCLCLLLILWPVSLLTKRDNL